MFRPRFTPEKPPVSGQRILGSLAIIEANFHSDSALMARAFLHITEATNIGWIRNWSTHGALSKVDSIVATIGFGISISQISAIPSDIKIIVLTDAFFAYYKQVKDYLIYPGERQTWIEKLLANIPLTIQQIVIHASHDSPSLRQQLPDHLKNHVYNPRIRGFTPGKDSSLTTPTDNATLIATQSLWPVRQDIQEKQELEVERMLAFHDNMPEYEARLIANGFARNPKKQPDYRLPIAIAPSPAVLIDLTVDQVEIDDEETDIEDNTEPQFAEIKPQEQAPACYLSTPPHQINLTAYDVPDIRPSALTVVNQKRKREQLCADEIERRAEITVKAILANKKSSVTLSAEEITQTILKEDYPKEFYEKLDADKKQRKRSCIPDPKTQAASVLTEEDTDRCVELAEYMANAILKLVKNHKDLRAINITVELASSGGNKKDYRRLITNRQSNGAQSILGGQQIATIAPRPRDKYAHTVFGTGVNGSLPKPAPAVVVKPAPVVNNSVKSKYSPRFSALNGLGANKSASIDHLPDKVKEKLLANLRNK